ncbi:MAG TPA: SdrD B-like domain-containing protein [Candidatus Eisenbacteria bacterium]|nr:SdrD B-like domain-containing protein [Candidatus Eisenbacteria bacterium]
MMPLPKHLIRGQGRHAPRGFTLIELMITLTVLAAVMVILLVMMRAAQSSKVSTSNQIEASQAARVALDMLTRDLRSAGYGVDRYYAAAPQPPIAYIDSLQVLINADLQPATAGTDTVPKSPLAYNPSGSPRPFPLNGTVWQPPIKYRRGAEVVRWTLDVDNDGQVNASDIAHANGIDARRTPNPNDYVLVRQIYGDSTGDIASYNGGQTERVTLVRRPGGTVPAMFQVYLEGSKTPWDWSNGPLPVTKLSAIERIMVEVVAPAARPDKKGNYAESRMRTEINSIRNVPNFGMEEYPVDGYVFNDVNGNGTQQVATEPGIPGAFVRCGSYSTTTAANGYYLFRVRSGTYTVKHTSAPGYHGTNTPDSTVVNLGPAASATATVNFADAATPGGWVYVMTYEDLNADGIRDAGEPGLQNVRLQMSPGGEIGYTASSGTATLFAETGSFTVTASAPDSFTFTTLNPVTGSMTDGGSASIEFGLTKTAVGTIQGTVYRDNNRDGVMNSGEPGIANVWVGVTKDGGLTIQGYKYTDGAGNYSVDVPINSPPATTPYAIMVIIPPGFYPTSTTSISPIWVTAGSTQTNKNFGMSAYQVIVLNASRVLSLASRDLIEKQGSDNGGTGARRDPDIVLGADAGGTDNVSIWYNQYDSTPIFDPNPSYTRNAPQSVLSVALDTLDSDVPKARPDLVTGTRKATPGNFFVWLNQNSGGNEGYYGTTYNQAYTTSNLGDVQSVLTLDCAGSSTNDQVDILVGTKSPTANQGSVELWLSNNATTPIYSRLETYPTSGGLAAASMGEVNAMTAADVNGDGLKDLIVGTKTGSYTGQLMIFRNNGKSSGSSRFTLAQSFPLLGAVTCIAATKVDYDSLTDIIVGLQTGVGAGQLQEFKNLMFAGVINFAYQRSYIAPGIPLSLVAADLGGVVGHDDLAMGWRENETSYVGGLRVLSMDSGRLPAVDSDPSAGSVINMVPALTVNNFNFGTQPVTPLPPYLTDVAAGIKVTALTGALVVFIR